MSALNNSRSFGKPLLCYVTDRRSLPGATPEASTVALLKKISQSAAAGVDWVQIREKDLSAKELASLTREALRITTESSSSARTIRVIVNDRLDIAVAERASGVHLGENSLPAAEAKRLIQPAQTKGLLGEAFLIGVSCHSVDSAKAAEVAGADYIFFGPVFATPSKSTFGEPQGLARLREVCRTVAIPVLAIGGITLDNTASCIEAGAAGIAAIRLFQDSSDPVRSVHQLRQNLTGSPRL